MNLHDDCYQEIEANGEEPVIIEMERENCKDIPAEYHDICRRNLSNSLAIKYERRKGHKDDAEKEQAKADNYRHRARTGEWLR